MRGRAHAAMIPSLNTALDELRHYLQAQPVTLETLPPEIAREWVYARRALQGGNPAERATRPTTRPCASSRVRCRRSCRMPPGGPIAILESGRTVVRAFFEAGFWALGSIVILLWIVLRALR